MTREQREMGNQDPWIVKLVSYVLAVGFGFLTYVSLVNDLGRQPAILAGAIVSLVALSVLSSLRDSLKLLVDEIPGAWRAIWEGINQIIAEPGSQVVRNAINSTIDTWRVVLLQPIRFGSVQFERISQRDIQGIIGVIVSLVLLLLLNSISVNWVFQRYSLGIDSFWNQVLWFCGLPIILIVWDIITALRKEPVLRIPPTSVVVWLFIVITWLDGILTQTALYMPGLNGGRILINTFVITITIGSLVRTRSGRTLGFEIVLMVFIASVIVAIPYLTPESLELVETAKTDPILAPVYQKYESIGFDAEYSEPPDQGEGANTPQQDQVLFTSLPLTVGTLVFVSGFVGVISGQYGFVLLLLEAPLFYLGWFLLSVGWQRRGLQLIETIVCLDESRSATWFGETRCYDRIARSAPQRLVSLLSVQLFHTERRPFALKYFSSFVLSMDPKSALEAIIPLVPFSRYEQLCVPRVPSLRTLSFAKHPEPSFARHPEPLPFYRVYEHHRDVFKDLLGQLLNVGSQSQDHRSKYVGMLSALDTISRSDWGDVKSGLEQASAIKDGLQRYQDVLYARGLYLLAAVVEVSLQVNEFQNISQATEAWQAFCKEVEQDQLLAPCGKLAQEFLGFSMRIQDSKDTDLELLAEGAFHYIAIQDMLLRHPMQVREHPGLHEFKLIASHWENLLRTAVRQYREQSPRRHNYV